MSYIERESLLIDVDSLISMMHVQAKGEPIQESAIKLVETTRDYIASFPAADVAEVRHGRWIVTDAVPVVRCKDCKHYLGVCSFLGIRMNPSDFCSYGEQKEADHD